MRKCVSRSLKTLPGMISTLFSIAVATKSLAATVLILMICSTRGTPAPATTTSLTPTCPQGLARAIPARPPGAITGSAFAARVAKISDVKKPVHTGPARVYDSEEICLQAILDGRIQPGDVLEVEQQTPDIVVLKRTKQAESARAKLVRREGRLMFVGGPITTEQVKGLLEDFP